jgi:hypothetical protein
MSFKSAEGSKFINDFSFVNFPTAQGEVFFPAGLTAGDVEIDPTGIINAEEFRVADQVYLASTGVEAPLVDCDDLVAKNLVEAKNLILLTAGEGGVITFEDGTSQSTAFFGGGTPVVYNQPVAPATASGATNNLFFNQTLVQGGVYACSVSVECQADVAGQSLDDYEVALSYNNVVLSKTQIYGVGDADAIISIPMTGFFIAVDANTTLIKCAVKCITSGGGNWYITADTFLNLVRLA